MKNSTYKGDVFYSPSSTLGGMVTFGHSGIYSEKDTIVEAPGSQYKVRSAKATGVKVISGAKVQYVNTSQANRNKAADLSKTFVGRAYNVNFALNKTKNGNMNCSQVVWVSYKDGAGIDLDSNGGPGVYPSDIRDSKLTITYRTL